ncbi:hypothetical protein [Enterococcus pernyi]|uniref:hypothetical protein n=1 Tax=Enterococcus pernyi TaxID=590158 RepID=UPI000789B554|nr:hypothetical protein [Enterococcus pernyi]
MAEMREFEAIVRDSIIQMSKADQSTRERVANEMQEQLRENLSPAGQSFVDDLCQRLVTQEPDTAIQEMGVKT